MIEKSRKLIKNGSKKGQFAKKNFFFLFEKIFLIFVDSVDDYFNETKS